MSKQAHTPGPWGVAFQKIIVDRTGATIAEVTNAKNVPLFRAAPELLEALIFLLKNFDSEKDSAKAIVDANKAIKKATG